MAQLCFITSFLTLLFVLPVVSCCCFPSLLLLLISADILDMGDSCFSAKNLALAGVKSLTLCDPKPIAICELSSQFYFTEADVGKNRAEVPLFYHFTCLFLPEAFLSYSNENVCKLQVCLSFNKTRFHRAF